MNNTIKKLVGLAAIATVGLGTSCSEKETTGPKLVNEEYAENSIASFYDNDNNGHSDLLRFKERITLDSNMVSYSSQGTWAHTDYVLDPKTVATAPNGREVKYNGTFYAPVVKDVSPEFFAQFENGFTGTIDETHVQKTWDNYDAMRVDIVYGYVTRDSR